MKIQEWFNNGCDYQEGVAIYASLKNAKTNLVQLFNRKKSTLYLEKLKYELAKHKDAETSIAPLVISSVDAPEITIVKEEPLYKPLRISDFPVALHQVYIKQKSDFANACSLKIQLNNLPAEAEEEALKLCLEIDRLFDAIELAWKQLDHYTETKTVLEVQINDFENLTPAQLLQRRNNKRSVLTKAKKQLEKYQIEQPTTIASKTKLSVKTEKQCSKIAQLEVDILELDKLINKK